MNYIQMAAIIGSGEFAAIARVACAFSQLLDACNRFNKQEVVSPLTIRLGDEFQVVVKEECSIYRIVSWFEENKWKAQEEIHLGHLVEWGKIETETTTKVARGMMGPCVNRCEK